MKTNRIVEEFARTLRRFKIWKRLTITYKEYEDALDRLHRLINEK